MDSLIAPGLGPANGVRLFLWLYVAALASQFLWCFREQVRYLQIRDLRLRPLPLLSVIPMPRLKVSAFRWVGAVWVICLLAACVGPFARLFLILSIGGYFLYFAQIPDLAYIRRKTNLIPLILLVCLFAPGIEAPLEIPAPLWPLFLVKLMIVLVYLASGISKLRYSGWVWADGRTLRANLLEHYLWGDMAVAHWLIQRPRACMLLSILTLGFELTFWLVLLFPALTLPYALLGLGFHLGTQLAMRINYLRYFGPGYLVFAIEPLMRFFWPG